MVAKTDTVTSDVDKVLTQASHFQHLASRFIGIGEGGSWAHLPSGGLLCL